MSRGRWEKHGRSSFLGLRIYVNIHTVFSMHCICACVCIWYMFPWMLVKWKLMEEILMILVMDPVIYVIDSWKMVRQDVYMIKRWAALPQPMVCPPGLYEYIVMRKLCSFLFAKLL